jgi:outer membrane protein assembly factor BamE
MSKLFHFLSVLAGLSAVSCSPILNNLPGVYTINVQQGNMIDQSMVDQLRPNMTKRQVLYIMGSPMLKDIFHQDRWDYIYSNQPGGEPRQQKKITLIFDGDNIVGIQGDFRPSSLPVVKESEETTVEVPKREVEKTLWEMLTGLFGFDDTDTPEKAPEPEKDNTADPASEKDLASDPDQPEVSP